MSCRPRGPLLQFVPRLVLCMVMRVLLLLRVAREPLLQFVPRLVMCMVMRLLLLLVQGGHRQPLYQCVRHAARLGIGVEQGESVPCMYLSLIHI